MVQPAALLPCAGLAPAGAVAGARQTIGRGRLRPAAPVRRSHSCTGRGRRHPLAFAYGGARGSAPAACAGLDRRMHSLPALLRGCGASGPPCRGAPEAPKQQIALRTGRARGRHTTGIKDAALHLSGLYSLYTRRLESEIRNGGMPNHVALILDGNRRWASRNLGLARVGHWRGADAVENLLDWCEEFDIKIITLYALSAENLGRRDDELDHLYELIEQRLEKLYRDPRIHRTRMRVTALGRVELLPRSIRDILARLDEATVGYSDHFLNLALAYGGQDELVDAVRKIGEKIRGGDISVSDIDKGAIESHLYTSHLPQPSPDMILRTSGEKRLSGFLLWQSAYSELVFMDIFWPEFRKIDLMRAIRMFQKRKRRAGR